MLKQYIYYIMNYFFLSIHREITNLFDKFRCPICENIVAFTNNNVCLTCNRKKYMAIKYNTFGRFGKNIHKYKNFKYCEDDGKYYYCRVENNNIDNPEFLKCDICHKFKLTAEDVKRNNVCSSCNFGGFAISVFYNGCCRTKDFYKKIHDVVYKISEPCITDGKLDFKILNSVETQSAHSTRYY